MTFLVTTLTQAGRVTFDRLLKIATSERQIDGEASQAPPFFDRDTDGLRTTFTRWETGKSNVLLGTFLRYG